jgi:hypothetical protein
MYIRTERIGWWRVRRPRYVWIGFGLLVGVLIGHVL